MTPDGGDGGNVVDCSMVPDWRLIHRVEPGVVTSATVGGGAVTIKASNAPGTCQFPQPACPTTAIQLSQGGVVEDADFQATLTFEDFRSADPGGAAGLVLQMDAGGGEIRALIRQADVPVLEVLMTGAAPASMPAAAAGGTFRVVRNAGLVTATATAGASSVEIAGTLNISSQMVAAIGIINRTEAVLPGETSIRFTDFQFAGAGGAILSDAFDCDSVP